MSWFHPEGVYAALPTPFQRDGDLDVPLLRELVAYFEGTGLDGLLVLGTAGESALLSAGERRQAIAAAAGAARRLKMIYNAGCASTRETIELARHARDAGAAAVLAVAPYFFHPTQEGIARHYLEVAAAVDAPVMAYNIPAFAGNRIEPATLDLLAEDGRIVGLKESSGDLTTLASFVSRAPGGFAVMAGADSLAGAALAIGARGMMIGGAAVAPRLCAELCRAFRRGDYRRAFELQRSLDQVALALQIGTFPAALKHAMTFLGAPAGYVRAPLQELTDRQKKDVEARLRNARLVQELYL